MQIILVMMLLLTGHKDPVIRAVPMESLDACFEKAKELMKEPPSPPQYMAVGVSCQIMYEKPGEPA